MKIIHLISGPRNISTALMYSFAQRPDTTVFDEPFYGVYLRKTGVEHPGKEDVLATQPQQEDQVIEQITNTPAVPVVFIKNMAHHLEVLDAGLPFDTTDIFLIRNPLHIISSYSKVIEKPVMRDIGLKFQYELFSRKRASNNAPVVVDSSVLLENPREVLMLLCNHIGLPFHSEMLHWERGPKPYDGVWAKYWYGTVHNSDSFKKPESQTRDIREDLVELYEEALEYYEKLVPYVIRP